jgi:hypothetical protein
LQVHASESNALCNLSPRTGIQRRVDDKISQSNHSSQGTIMFSKVKTLVFAASISAILLLGTPVAEAAKPQPRRSPRRPIPTTNAAVLYWYGLAPYAYYDRYGIQPMQGAPVDNPLPYGTSEIPFGMSGFGYDVTGFGF